MQAEFLWIAWKNADKSELIACGGETSHPQEIENAECGHPRKGKEWREAETEKKKNKERDEKIKSGEAALFKYTLNTFRKFVLNRLNKNKERGRSQQEPKLRCQLKSCQVEQIWEKASQQSESAFVHFNLQREDPINIWSDWLIKDLLQ